MNTRNLAILVPSGLLALAVGCSKPADTVERKSEATTETAAGTYHTSIESTQVGTTLEATSKTEVDTSSGTATAKAETVVGTVTEFAPGEKVKVMAGDKNTHSFDLDDKDVIYSIDSGIAVGKRVTVIDQTGADKVRRITVRLGG